MEITLAALFWACLAAVLYAYAGYPLAVRLLARRFGRRGAAPEASGELPSLSLVVAAHNEEAVIEARIRNALALDYPADRFEVVVACDGCDDATGRLARRFDDPRVRVLDFRDRRGKAATLNEAFGLLRGEVVMLSDANTHTEPAAARNLARWFRDPAVGVVCGKLVLTDPATGRNVDGMYWKYETAIKRAEGALGALLGANGGIYAVRRRLFSPLPVNTIIDDFVLPLQARLHSGCDIVFDAEAVAHEETPPDVRAEFRRRSRIGAGGFQSMARLAGLLDPRQGWVALTFLSHKVLRWLCPFFLLGMLATGALLSGDPVYQLALAGQAAFYLVALLGAFVPGRSLPARLVRLTTMFVSMNAALLVGFWKWAWGTQKAAWHRTARTADSSFDLLVPAEPARAVPVAQPQEA